MAQANIKLNEESEKVLTKVMTIGYINDLKLVSKEQQINQALLWLDGLISSLDDESLQQTINIKKSY